ncbi:AAA family ATPase [Proteiniphilum sp. UBA5463]|jgi:hypothetical protein|uniref:AAA family ATPase n=1 Tax=Proteiniphilum sp. UBA5463 TaxID=1947281 RepID=UPI00257F9CF6|nr:ATP-binding protein [Proteiniphilum sp. UBA5463]
MQSVPFTYGRITEPIDFTDRDSEIMLLKRNFNARVNTIIISPRRWGKSSLVKKAASEAVKQNDTLKVCFIDIFNYRNENEFYLALANEVLKSTSSEWEELVQNAKTFLSRLIPSVSFSPDKQTELSFGIGWDEMQKHPDEILDLAEKIAHRKEINIIVCIDEFQSVASFPQPEMFQRKLRAHWQNHTRVSYCLYGSKRHMLLDVFTNPSMPFYKFGHLLFLKKIDSAHWINFIQKRFYDTGKQISDHDAALIASLADNHSYYVQQLAQQTWFRTNKMCKTENVTAAREDIVDQLSLLFANLTETLSSLQLNILRAIISGEKQLTAQDTLKKYRMGTSANVVRNKKQLIVNETLIEEDNVLSFSDPMYRYWLESRFFKIIP